MPHKPKVNCYTLHSSICTDKKHPSPAKPSHNKEQLACVASLNAPFPLSCILCMILLFIYFHCTLVGSALETVCVPLGCVLLTVWLGRTVVELCVPFSILPCVTRRVLSYGQRYTVGRYYFSLITLPWAVRGAALVSRVMCSRILGLLHCKGAHSCIAHITCMGFCQQFQNLVE